MNKYVIAITCLCVLLIFILFLIQSRKIKLRNKYLELVKRYPNGAVSFGMDKHIYLEIPTTNQKNKYEKENATLFLANKDDIIRREDSIRKEFKEAKKKYPEIFSDSKKEIQNEHFSKDCAKYYFVSKIKKIENSESKDPFETPQPKNYKSNNCNSTKEITNNKRNTVSLKKELRVQYNMESAPYKTDNNFYMFCGFPKFKCIVFPYRDCRIRRQGLMENSFGEYLEKNLPENIKIVVNASIALYDKARPYEPDIALVVIGSKNIRIDIEIDEPYAGFTKEPIHYIGCGDEFRDLNLINAGWVVLRFAEEQIKRYQQCCIFEIYKLLHHLDPSIVIPKDLTMKTLPKIKRWTELDAKIMASNNYREKYLNHTFEYNAEKNQTQGQVIQTQEERELSRKLEQIPHLKKQHQINIDKTNITFQQDSDINFFAKEHLYLYKNSIQLMAVSDVINIFFKPFDSIKMSKKKAIQKNVTQCRILEEWDCEGTISREAGTFLHQQIYSYFNGEPTSMDYYFEYKGNEFNYKKNINISKEWSYFHNFLTQESLKPFRTEWQIYDPKLKIAGTIDFLCRCGSEYDLYDWKRSDKIDQNARIWDYGINGLNDVPNTRYYHYCIQLNLYKYILEKNYALKIRQLYLIALHPSNEQYVKIQVKDMQNEIQIIIKYLSKNISIL